jgi:predicted phage terminase large subunit-like protein
MSSDMLSDLDFEMLKTKRPVRMNLAEQSHFYFFHLYMGHYVHHPTADFHKEMYALTEDESIKHAVVVAFRDSGKSTIMTVSYPIWAILGKQKKKFVVIFSQTQPQARADLVNVKREFESNELLRKDYGPLEEESDEWGTSALMLPRFNARIIAASAEQSIRGIRHGAFRPDLIIADDVEDLNSVKTRAGRNKTYDWFSGDVMPLGDLKTKFITIGNLLHEDSLLMRLKEKIEAGVMHGVFRSYPLIDEGGKCMWPGKYPNAESLVDQEMTIGNRIAFHREFLLKILPTDEQVVHREWLGRYDQLPDRNDPISNYRGTYLAVDLAISQKDSADYTAMIAVHVFGWEENMKLYIDPLIVNARLTHLQTLVKIGEVVERLGGKYKVQVIVEEVAYQSAVIEQLRSKGFRVEPFPVHGSDKRARLISVSHLFQSQKVYFPNSPQADEIISQVVGFGIEKFDDLMDSLVMDLSKALSVDSHIGHYDAAYIKQMAERAKRPARAINLGGEWTTLTDLHRDIHKDFGRAGYF